MQEMKPVGMNAFRPVGEVRAEFVDRLAAKLELTPKQTTAVLNLAFRELVHSIALGGVQWPNFGAFELFELEGGRLKIRLKPSKAAQESIRKANVAKAVRPDSRRNGKIGLAARSKAKTRQKGSQGR